MKDAPRINEGKNAMPHEKLEGRRKMPHVRTKGKAAKHPELGIRANLPPSGIPPDANWVRGLTDHRVVLPLRKMVAPLLKHERMASGRNSQAVTLPNSVRQHSRSEHMPFAGK